MLLFRKFRVEAAKVRAAEITISNVDLNTAFDGLISNVVEDFLANHKEYSECTYTKEYTSEGWIISFWTTSEVVYKEVK